MPKKEVIKHSAAIQMTNDITLTQRKAWNVLLANAFHEPEKEIYKIDLDELMDYLNITKTNISHLKSSIVALQQTQAEFNVLDKDKTIRWGSIQIMGDVVIDEENGTCTYSYTPFLKRMLFTPEMYAKINLNVQKRITSKHALAIYELCFDYMDKKAGIGETPFINLYTLRKLLGIGNEEYTEFKAFNRRAIKQPVREINEKSDIEVTAKYRKKGRNVEAIKFRSKKKTIKPMPVGKIEDRFEQIFRRLPEDEQRTIFQDAVNNLSKFDMMDWNTMAKRNFSLATPTLQKKIIKNRNKLIKEKF